MDDDSRRILSCLAWMDVGRACLFADRADTLARCISKGWVRAVDGGYQATDAGTDALLAAAEERAATVGL